MESTRVLHLGLYLAHDLFGAALPVQLPQEIRRDPAVQYLAEKVYEQNAGISASSAGVLPRTVFRLRSKDRFWPGLRHLLRLGMSRTERDLPRYLAPLYVLVQPWRLLTEYGWGWKRRARNAPSTEKATRKGSRVTNLEGEDRAVHNSDAHRED